MIFQNNLEHIITCSRCNNREVCDFLPDNYGMPHEDDAVISLPLGWYIQMGGDYCGGRWIYFFCSKQCAKIPVQTILPPFSEAERSILLYLFDAIKVAPEKTEKLIEIINKKNRSERFIKLLSELNESKNFLETVGTMRESLR